MNLFDKEQYSINYLRFRRTIISSYETDFYGRNYSIVLYSKPYSYYPVIREKWKQPFIGHNYFLIVKDNHKISFKAMFKDVKAASQPAIEYQDLIIIKQNEFYYQLKGLSKNITLTPLKKLKRKGV